MSVETSLALDMALRTGWAFGSHMGPELWGAWDVRETHGLGPRLLLWRTYLRKQLDDLGPTRIWIEKPIGVSGASVNLCRGFQAVVLIEAAVRKLDVQELAPASLKKATTGNGRAGKIAMRDAAQAWIGNPRTPIGDDWDIADALCLLKYGVGQEGLKV